jgi:hypothetical protein
LHPGLAEAVFSTVRPCLVVFGQPSIQIGLEFVKAVVDLLAEGDLIELLQEGLVEAFADAVGLRTAGFGFGMVDVLDGQIELVLVVLAGATVLRAAVGGDSSTMTYPPRLLASVPTTRKRR